jgi:5-methylcytosine-specific restriction enzyme subunit McrC
MPRATAEALVNHPWLREGLRAALRQSLAGFAEVAPVPTAEVALDRLTEDYRPLLDLCGLVRDGLAGGRNEGAVTCPAFLLDMERVFERYVTAGFVAALGGGPVHVAVQPTFAASVAVAGQPDLCMRPDLVVLREGRPVLVADVKWKRVAGTPLVTADLYQVLAYATALGVQRAVLIYPGGRGRAWRYRMARSPVEVEIRAVRVVGAPEACNRSLLRAGIGLHRLLSGLLKDS